MADIVITPQNSPYNIQGGTQSYGTVEIQVGGYMQMLQQTKLTITTMIVDQDSGTLSTAKPTSKKKSSSSKKRR
jgi:hypothetical protein